MNKQAYISPVVRTVGVGTTEMLLAFSDASVSIGSGTEEPDNFDVKGAATPVYNVWDDDWSN